MPADGVSDPITFASDDRDRDRTRSTAPNWKILVVDDDQEVHAITRLVLSGYRFEGRGIDLFNARSAQEARIFLQAHPDTAAVLLDVVMEDEHAGLALARFIRETLRYHALRIILRTGQPGQAPEMKVVVEYDIDDYKEKTELTATRLLTTVVTALRTHRHLRQLEKHRQALEFLVQTSAKLLEHRSLKAFLEAVLATLADLLDSVSDGSRACRCGLAATWSGSGPNLLAATGEYVSLRDSNLRGALPEEVLDYLERQRPLPASLFGRDHYAGITTVGEQDRLLVFVRGSMDFGELERDLIRVFAMTIFAACQNVRLVEDLRQALIRRRRNETDEERRASDRLMAVRPREKPEA